MHGYPVDLRVGKCGTTTLRCSMKSASLLDFAEWAMLRV
jgi:hypothetical protein